MVAYWYTHSLISLQKYSIQAVPGEMLLTHEEKSRDIWIGGSIVTLEGSLRWLFYLWDSLCI